MARNAFVPPMDDIGSASLYFRAGRGTIGASHPDHHAFK
jgi:hypothetical protein